MVPSEDLFVHVYVLIVHCADRRPDHRQVHRCPAVARPRLTGDTPGDPRRLQENGQQTLNQ